MSMQHDQVTALMAIAGGRVELERELMWTVALGGPQERIEQLERMLARAANDNSPIEVCALALNRGESGVT